MSTFPAGHGTRCSSLNLMKYFRRKGIAAGEQSPAIFTVN